MKALTNKPALLAIFFLSVLLTNIFPIQSYAQEMKGITSDFTISGNVKFNAGQGLKNFTGVEINFPGVGTAIANISGNFSLKVPAGYTGTLTPIVCDNSFYSFNPPSIQLTNVNGNISGNNFTATVPGMFTISGAITEKNTGVPLANTEIDLVTETRYGHGSFVYKVNTNALGQYSLDVLPCWTNFVDPRFPNHYFESTEGGFKRNYSEVKAHFPNQNFTYINFEYPTPPGWSFTNTGTVHTISIDGNSNPAVCGTPIKLGDLVGAFYYDNLGELKCGGFARWHNEASESNVSVVAMGNDSYTNNLNLRYDAANNVNVNYFGLTAGGTFHAAIYLPAAIMSQYAGQGAKLTSIRAYIRELPTSMKLKVWGEGTPNSPGDLLHEQTVTPGASQWNVFTLSNQLNIDGTGIWVGYEVTHASAKRPAGYGASPQVTNGDWIEVNGVWQSLKTYNPALNNNWNIAAIINIKDGFSPNELFNWRVYSYDLDEVLPATPTFQTGGFLSSNNRWGPSGLSLINQLNIVYGNNILLPAGWSGVSSYTPPASLTIANVMAPIINDLVLIQSTTGMYYPQMGINNLFVWTTSRGYKIKVNKQTVLPIPGCVLTNRTVSLTTGWNLMPVLTKCNVLVTDVLSPIMNRITVIKEVAGNKIYWPAMGIETLKILESNKAYYILVTQNSSFTYPLCDNFKSAGNPQMSEEINLTSWANPVKTGFTHTLGLTMNALEAAESGDYIGVFTQDETCAGLLMIDDPASSAAITVYGDDMMEAEKNGFSEGELLSFRLFKTKTGEVVTLVPYYESDFPSYDGTFSDNGLSVIKGMEILAPGITSPDNRVGFYPNPTNGMIHFVTQQGNIFSIKLQDLSGRVLEYLSIEGAATFDFSSYPPGIYVVVIEGEHSLEVKKLILK